MSDIARTASTPVYERWVAQALARPGNGRRIVDQPRASSPRTVAEMLADIDSDH